MIRILCASTGVAILCVIQSSAAWAQHPFLSDTDWSNLRHEASGTAPFENLRALTRLHRVPATPEFDQAANFILGRAQEYGLQDVHAEQFPIDGKIEYGLMRSHIAWKQPPAACAPSRTVPVPSTSTCC